MGNSQKARRVIIYDSELRELLVSGAKEKGVSISEYAKNIMRYAIKNTDTSNARYDASSDSQYNSDELMELKVLHQQMLRQLGATTSNLNQSVRALNAMVKNNKALMDGKDKALFNNVLKQVEAVNKAYGVVENDIQKYVKIHKK